MRVWHCAVVQLRVRAASSPRSNSECANTITVPFQTQKKLLIPVQLFLQSSGTSCWNLQGWNLDDASLDQWTLTLCVYMCVYARASLCLCFIFFLLTTLSLDRFHSFRLASLSTLNSTRLDVCVRTCVLSVCILFLSFCLLFHKKPLPAFYFNSLDHSPRALSLSIALTSSVSPFFLLLSLSWGLFVIFRISVSDPQALGHEFFLSFLGANTQLNYWTERVVSTQLLA